MHPFARKGRALIFENRKLEIKENYNSYNEIKRGIVLIFRLCDCSIAEIEQSEQSINLNNEKFLAKRIRAHDGCLGISRL